MAHEGGFHCVSAKESDAPPGLPVDLKDFTQWSLKRAILAEFIATLLFLYVTIATVIGHVHSNGQSLCEGAAIMGLGFRVILFRILLEMMGCFAVHIQYASLE
ncbi:hypothetical protein SUGI_1138730 [Cryptomeria japonica]|nr:hypothetical protein SUGI_1138730 [Cryptomeria japonica]